MEPCDPRGLDAEEATQFGLLDPQIGDRVRVMQGTHQGKTGIIASFRDDGKALVQSDATHNLKPFSLDWLQVVDRASSEPTNGKVTHDQKRTISPEPEPQHSPPVAEPNARSKTHDFEADTPRSCVHWVQIYSNRAGLYYRYCYLQGETFRPKRVHIPGGNSHSSLARKRKALLELAILEGKSISECLVLIKSWRKSNL
jgi:hypothetical protein